MGEFSADTRDLGMFVDAGGRYVGRLQAILDQVDRTRSMTLAQFENVPGPPSSSGAFEELIGSARHVNQFVASIVESLEAATGVAGTEGIEMTSAASLLARADHYAMTVSETMAYDGLNQHFDVFDNATGGGTDGIVSTEDLQYVADRPERFGVAEAAAAAALLDNPGLLSRLDSGRDNNDVLADGNRFGREDFDDRKISLDDVENFEWKQAVNALVGVHYDAIDLVNGGPADGHLSKADFEAFLDQHRSELSDAEVQALQIVIDGELYDKGWLERNKRSLAIATAVVVGAAIAVGTGGIGAGISGALITAAVTGAGGAAAAGGTTMFINGFSPESDWDDDLVVNAGHGFLGGMAGGGLGVAGPAWGATSGLGRLAVASGLASDGTAIIGMGGVDWALDTVPGVEHQDLDDVHDVANRFSLVLGATGLYAAGAQGATNLYNRNMAAGIADAVPESVVADLETFVPHGLSRSQAELWLDQHPDGIAMLEAAVDSQIRSMGDGVDFFMLPPTERGAVLDDARDLLIGQVATGVQAPVRRETSESLYMLVPAGENPTNYAPSWMTRDELDHLIGNRRDLADALALPYASHADEYRVWRIDPINDRPISVFASEVAPTTELYGLVATRGGTEQILVPNRSLFHDAIVDVTEPIINRSNGGLLAPAREAAAVVYGSIDQPVTARPSVANPSAQGATDQIISEELLHARP